MMTDFSSFVTKVPSDTDVVFFPTQAPPDAQTFGQQLIEQGKKAKVFGGDGTNDPAQFKVAGLVRVQLRRPINLFPYNKAIVDRWKKDNPGCCARLVRPADVRCHAGAPGRRSSGPATLGKGTIKDRRTSSATSSTSRSQLDPRR